MNSNLAKRLSTFKGYRANPASLYGRKLGATHLATPSRMNGHFKIGSTVCQWQESPPGTFVGNADSICRSIRHNGWYTTQDENGENGFDDTCWGVVYKLPHDKYLAAVTDSNNASHKNAERSPCIMEVGWGCIYDTKEEAASAADSLAECHAEEAHEYSAKDSAEQTVERLKEENMETLSEVSSLIAEMKSMKGTAAPSICAVLWSRIKHARREMQANRRKAVELRDRFNLTAALCSAE